MKIIDTGVGIKKENLPKLFMDFAKLDEHSKINAQGTGLGLSICKRMIEQMGGTVKVDSDLGEGTEFTINLSTKVQNYGKNGKKTLKNNDSYQIDESQQSLLNDSLRQHRLPSKKSGTSVKSTVLNCLVANDDNFQLMMLNFNLN